MMKEILQGFKWNAASPEGVNFLHNVLVKLLSFAPDRSPKPIGTAFIVGAFGSHAVAISAAHNFWLGVHKAQNPNPPHNPTALHEFLPNYEEIHIDRINLRAIYEVGTRTNMCILGNVIWDKKTDLAIFTLFSQDMNDKTVFQHQFSLMEATINVGDVVGVAGYGSMEIMSESRDGSGNEKFTMSSRLLMRAGTVRAIFPDGHILCRGPCFETSIPVFGGMSGGPAFLIPQAGQKIVPLGVISSDNEEPIEAKNDRSRSGASIVATLTQEIVDSTEAKTEAIFRFSQASFALNQEFVGKLKSNYHTEFDQENS